jgi:hypothetical protein
VDYESFTPQVSVEGFGRTVPSIVIREKLNQSGEAKVIQNA